MKLYKYFILFVAFNLFFPFAVQPRSFETGLTIGANLSSPNKSFETDDSTFSLQTISPNYLIGLYGSYQINSKGHWRLEWQPGIHYSNVKTAVILDEILNVEYKQKTSYLSNLHYLYFPMNITLMYSKSSNFQPFISFGTSMQFLLDAEQAYIHSIDYGNSKTENFYSKKGREDFSLLDFGISIGSGIKTMSGLSLKARYQHGLTNIKQEQLLLNDFKTQRNRYFSIIASFPF